MSVQTLNDFLRDPHSYGADCRSVDFMETHISQIFLTESFAYKLKKTISLPFVDYASVAAREKACRDELTINTDFAPGMYLKVVSINRDDSGHLSFDGPGEAVDFVVKMRRYKESDRLDLRLLHGSLSEPESAQLLKHLETCFRNMTPSPQPPSSYLLMLEQHIRENIVSLRELAESQVLDPLDWVVQCSRQLLMLRVFPDLFLQRAESGWVRLGHGDLKPEHIIMQSPPVVMDAVEFDASFRTLDLADELSFLELETEVLGLAEWGRRIRSSVLGLLGDHVSPMLLAFYRSYRACVRAKVLLFRAQQLKGEEQQAVIQRALVYQKAGRQAVELALPVCVLFVAGPMGSGKTSLAQAISQDLMTNHHESDGIRREILGDSKVQHGFAEGRYSEDARQRVYGEMLVRMQADLRNGMMPVIDGSFSQPAFFEGFRSSLSQQNIPFLIVSCKCPDAVAIDRIGKRRELGTSSSEARKELYALQKQLGTWCFAPEEAIEINTEIAMKNQMLCTYEGIRKRLLPDEWSTAVS